MRKSLLLDGLQHLLVFFREVRTGRRKRKTAVRWRQWVVSVSTLILMHPNRAGVFFQPLIHTPPFRTLLNLCSQFVWWRDNNRRLFFQNSLGRKSSQALGFYGSRSINMDQTERKPFSSRLIAHFFPQKILWKIWWSIDAILGKTNSSSLNLCLPRIPSFHAYSVSSTWSLLTTHNWKTCKSFEANFWFGKIQVAIERFFSFYFLAFL